MSIFSKKAKETKANAGTQPAAASVDVQTADAMEAAPAQQDTPSNLHVDDATSKESPTGVSGLTEPLAPSTQDTSKEAAETPPARHRTLGLEDHEAVEILHDMIMARALDQKMYQLNRMGRAAFMVSSQGHEAVQVGAARAMVVGTDFVLPYYRDLAMMISLGVTPYQALLGLFGRADDPSSGGRQMPNHWSFKDINVVTGSSPIATHLPHATGIAQAVRLDGSDAVVFCSFGDGATSKGDFHEAMNFAGIHALPVVFLCENNGYAISVPLAKESAVTDLELRGAAYNIPGISVDGNDPLAVYEAVRDARARASEGPTFIVASCYRFLAHTSDDDDRSYRTPEEVAEARAHDPIERYVEYLKLCGLVDADEVARIYDSAKEIVDLETDRAEAALPPDPGSIFAHVFAPHEPATVRTLSEHLALGGERRIGTYIEAIRETQAALLGDDPNALVIGEDVGIRGGVFKATEGLFERFGEDRVVDMPLAESLIIGNGIGLALAGKHPIVEIQFADFIHSGFDQMLSEAARVHYRSNGAYTVPMVVRTPYGGGIHGALYHSQSIEAFYAHIPGIKVVAPSTPADAVGLLRSAMEDPNPVLFLEHKKAYRLVKGVIPDQEYRVPIGKADIVRPGSDLTIITYGLLRHYAEMAAESLSESASIEVVDLRTISPLDRELILDSATRCSRVLIVHEDNISFGVGGEVAALISQHAFWALDAPVTRLALPDVPTMGFAKNIEVAMTITAERIAEEAAALLKA